MSRLVARVSFALIFAFHFSYATSSSLPASFVRNNDEFVIPSTAQNDSFFVRNSDGSFGTSRKFVVGSNFIPSTAQNELAMWQEDTWDPDTIERELGYAEGLGFTAVRVFLHNLAFSEDPSGFIERVKQYLDIATSHHIETMFVLLDSCWTPDPKVGPQPDPVPFVHNSVWVQSPGPVVVGDPSLFEETVKPYVETVIEQLTNSDGILAWDIWNEPDNNNSNRDPDVDHVPLLKSVFAWARAVKPNQPLTTPIWYGGSWESYEDFNQLQKLQLSESDIVSFHCYDPIEGLSEKVEALKKHFDKPIICTEYMARGVNSTFDPHLGYLASSSVSALNWGLVTGLTQTCYPWDSMGTPNPYEGIGIDELDWFHDILYPNGTAKYEEEREYIERITKN